MSNKPSDKPSKPKPVFTKGAKLLAAPYEHSNGAIVHYHDGAHAYNAQCRYVGTADEALAKAAAAAIAPPAPSTSDTAPVAQPETAAPATEPAEPDVKQSAPTGKGR